MVGGRLEVVSLGGAVSENFGIVEGLSAKFLSHVGCTRGSEARGKTWHVQFLLGLKWSRGREYICSFLFCISTLSLILFLKITQMF